MKSQFKENFIDLSVPISGDIRTTKSELTYYSEIAKCYILVPVGIKTDLGSIPQILQNIFPKDGKAMFAYILHDYLYQTGMYKQSICDDILAEAMESLEVDWWREKAVRGGLRVGGFVAYNNYRNGKEETK